MAIPPEPSPDLLAHAKRIARIFAAHGEVPPSNYHELTVAEAEFLASERERWFRRDREN